MAIPLTKGIFMCVLDLVFDPGTTVLLSGAASPKLVFLNALAPEAEKLKPQAFSDVE